MSKKSGDRKGIRRMSAALLAFLMLGAGLPVARAEEEIVLSFAGDCTLGTMKEFQKYAQGFVIKIGELGLDYPFSGVEHIFGEDDLTLVNLEGVFTDATEHQDKRFVFKGPPAYAQILSLGSVEAVNIANNHINDYLEKGREDTLAALEANGVRYSGDGKLAIMDIKGVKIGMTGYTYTHRHTLKKLASDVTALRNRGCDIIIFSMHCGREEQYPLSGEQKTIARGAIDLGVDIVVGHHPHVVQGVEIYRGKPIFYSLGNFSFGGNSNPKDWDSMIGQVVLEKDETGVGLGEMRVIPCLISGATGQSDYRPVVAEGKRAEDIMRKIRRYSVNVEDSLFETGALSLRDLPEAAE